MAFARKDHVSVAKDIREKEHVDFGGRRFYLTRENRAVTALLMGEYFAARDSLFDKLAFLNLCRVGL